MKIPVYNPIRNRLCALFCLATAAASLSVSCGQAATLWYDGGTANISTNGDGISQTATGNWDTTTTNWDIGNGLPHTNWNNSINGGDTAIFNTSTNAIQTITVAATGVSVGNLVLLVTTNASTARCTIAGATGAALTLGAVNSSATIDYSSGISLNGIGGSINVPMTGALGGALTIIGANNVFATNFNKAAISTTVTPRLNLLDFGPATNTFTGAITITNILELQAATTAGSARWDQLGVATNNVTLNNGALFLYNGDTARFKNFDHNITVIGISNAINAVNTQSNIVTGSITSTSSDVLWSVVGSLTGGVNRLTYTGDLSGFAGTLIFRGGSATTSTNVIDCPSAFGGTLMVDSGILQVGNNDTKGSLGANNITNNGTIFFNRTDSVTYPGSFFGSGALSIYKGGLNVSGNIGSTGALTVTNNSTLNVTGNIGSTGAVGVYGTLNVTGNIPSISGLNLGNALASPVASGTVTLSGTYTYIGKTVVNVGTLTLSGPATMASTNIAIGYNTILDVSALTPPLALSAGQTLSGVSGTVSSGSTPPILNGSVNISAGGPMALTYNVANAVPALMETNGTLTLNNNFVKLTIGGSTKLTNGVYQLISTGTGGTLAGSISATNFTGLAGKFQAGSGSAALSLTSSGLYLTVSQPVATPMTVSALAGQNLIIAFSDVATNWSNADGLPVTLSGLNSTSTNGVALTTNSTSIFYQGKVTANDQINYTITDGQGGTNSAVINIVVNSGGVSGQTSPSINVVGGTATVGFAGIPSYTYYVQRATTVSGSWVNVSTNVAPAHGLFQFIDTNAPGSSAFYRLSTAP